jgi:hypothetical protein
VMQLVAYIQSLQAPGAEVVAPPGAGGIKLEGGASPAPRR